MGISSTRLCDSCPRAGFQYSAWTGEERQMKKFSIVFVSLVAMASFALGQAKQPDPKAGSAAPPIAGSAAPAPAKTGSGAGSAAPAKTGSGAGSAAPAKTGSGAGSAAATTGGAAAPKMEAPKPPTEIAAMMKQMGPRSNCTGIGMGGADMK